MMETKKKVVEDYKKNMCRHSPDYKSKLEECKEISASMDKPIRELKEKYEAAKKQIDMEK